jgi:hypothetical protein
MAVRGDGLIGAFRFRPSAGYISIAEDFLAEIFGLCVGLLHDVRFDFRVLSLVTFFRRGKKVTNEYESYPVFDSPKYFPVLQANLRPIRLHYGNCHRHAQRNHWNTGR